jgi:hypothetical protein
VVAAGSERRCDITANSASLPHHYYSGELLLSSSKGSWPWVKRRVSAANHGRRRGSKMAEGFGQKRPPWPPFVSVSAEVQSSLPARERSGLALGHLGEGVGGWRSGLAKQNGRRGGVLAL